MLLVPAISFSSVSCLFFFTNVVQNLKRLWSITFPSCTLSNGNDCLTLIRLYSIHSPCTLFLNTFMQFLYRPITCRQLNEQNHSDDIVVGARRTDFCLVLLMQVVRGEYPDKLEVKRRLFFFLKESLYDHGRQKGILKGTTCRTLNQMGHNSRRSCQLQKSETTAATDD